MTVTYDIPGTRDTSPTLERRERARPGKKVDPDAYDQMIAKVDRQLKLLEQAQAYIKSLEETNAMLRRKVKRLGG